MEALSLQNSVANLPNLLFSVTCCALVEDLARAHWFLKRASKRLEEIEYELPSNAYHWTNSHQQLFANFSRYKTAAERSFLRYVKEIESQLDKKERPPSAASAPSTTPPISNAAG